MPRPAMKASDKRKNVNISIRQDVLEQAKASGNASRFFERSVEVARGVLELMGELRAGKAKRPDVLEEIEDIVDAWAALGEEVVPLEKAFPKARARRARAKPVAEGRKAKPA